MTKHSPTLVHRRLARHLLPLTLVASFLGFAVQPLIAATYNGPIKVHPQNRRYFQFGNTCKALYLAGTHHRQNLQDADPDHNPPQFPYLFDFNASYPPADAPNANFIRGWHWEHSRWERGNPPDDPNDDGMDDWIYPLPFVRTGPGTAHDGLPKFNVYSYNGGYETRFQNRSGSAQTKGMILSIMLFQGFSVESLSNPGEVEEHPEVNHPLQAENNVNGIDGDWDPTNGHPGVSETHLNVLANAAALKVQSKYIAFVLDGLNAYKGLFWEVSNESNENSLAWQNLTATTIRNIEAGLANQHLVWISHPRGVSNSALYGSSADIVSPSWREPAVTVHGTSPPGSVYQTDPPVTSGAKVVILDTDHLFPACNWCDASWVWKAFTRGYHVALLDDVPDNPSKRQAVRRGIKDTLGYANKMQLLYMAPQDENATTPCSTRYCLYTSDEPDPQPYAAAVPNGHQYLVFKPAGTGTLTIDGLLNGTYSGSWLRVSNSATQVLASFSHPGGSKTFSSPWGTDAAVLFIKDGTQPFCP